MSAWCSQKRPTTFSLEASIESQRPFVANASHELRARLTVEPTLLQVALADPDVMPRGPGNGAAYITPKVQRLLDLAVAEHPQHHQVRIAGRFP